MERFFRPRRANSMTRSGLRASSLTRSVSLSKPPSDAPELTPQPSRPAPSIEIDDRQRSLTSTPIITTDEAHDEDISQLDYSLWASSWWQRIPKCELTPGRIRGWFWSHGYRILNKQQHTPRHFWVCSICVAHNKPPRTDRYSFVSSTGKSIAKHLMKVHGLRPPLKSRVDRRGENLTTVSSVNRPSIVSLLKLDMRDPTVQDTVAKVQSLYNKDLFWLLLLDWIIHDNLSFRIVLSQRFRRALWPPTYQPISHLTSY